MAVVPSPSAHLIASAELIKQGAEARVYLLPSILPTPITYTPSSSSSSSSSTSSPSSAAPQSVIIKHRFPKTYRHPTLNANLTKTRLSYEARALSRCQRAGVVVPSVLWVDEAGGTLGLDKIDGWSVREILGGGAEGEVEVVDEEEVEIHGSAGPSGAADSTATRATSARTAAPTDGGLTERTDGISEDMQGLQVDGAQGVEPVDEEEISEGLIKLREVGVTPEHLMSSIGTALARLHSTITTHGDLTTSNMMVRLTPGKAQPYEIVLIDFGLASGAQYAEHYAVDLYVLERAFASTHPASEKLYAGVLEAYGVGMGKKWKDIEKKLAEVRLRGRKRDMTG